MESKAEKVARILFEIGRMKKKIEEKEKELGGIFEGSSSLPVPGKEAAHSSKPAACTTGRAPRGSLQKRLVSALSRIGKRKFHASELNKRAKVPPVSLYLFLKKKCEEGILEQVARGLYQVR